MMITDRDLLYDLIRNRQSASLWTQHRPDLRTVLASETAKAVTGSTFALL